MIMKYESEIISQQLYAFIEHLKICVRLKSMGKRSRH